MVDKLDTNFSESISSPKISLSYLFWNFLKIGSTAFGGFMALVSAIENVIVGKRKLLTHEDMLDGISLASVLPGPVAANVVAYVGYRLGGFLGSLMTTIAVLLPSFLLVVALTIVYLQAGDIPAVKNILAGFIPAVVAIIISAATRMSQKAIKGWREIIIAVVAAILLKIISGFYITLIVIFGSGLIGWFCFRGKVAKNLAESATQTSNESLQIKKIMIPGLILAGMLLLSLIPLPLGQDSLAKLFVTFSGMSLTLFGGGYVFIPMIQEVVVNNYHWVTQEQFSNAIAIGQITPGPVSISAASIGYVVKGFVGAAVATIGIFFPPALLIITMSHLLEHIKNSVTIQAILKGIRPAVIGMIFTAAIVVGQTAPLHWASIVIYEASLVAIWIFNLEVVLIIPIAGVVGLFLY